MSDKRSYKLELNGMTKGMNQTFYSNDIEAIRLKLDKAKTSRLYNGWTLYWANLIIRKGSFRSYSFK